MVIFIVCIKFKEIKILLKELSLATIWIFLAWVKKWLTARIFSRTQVFWKTGTETLWVCHKVKRFNNYEKASKEIKERMLQMWMITWEKVKRTYCHLVKNITPIWALLLFQLCYKPAKTILQTIIKSSNSNLKIEELSNQTAKCWEVLRTSDARFKHKKTNRDTRKLTARTNKLMTSKTSYRNKKGSLVLVHSRKVGWIR